MYYCCDTAPKCCFGEVRERETGGGNICEILLVRFQCAGSEKLVSANWLQRKTRQ
jgi:hypothetical protein